MNIKLGRGLEDVRFGISQDALVELLGPPDKYDTDGFEAPLLIYNAYRSIFWFSLEDELHWIQCSNSISMIWNQKLIGQSFVAKKALIASHAGEPTDIDDFGSMESYSYDSCQLEIQVEFGTIQTICFGNLWEDGDTPIYPRD